MVLSPRVGGETYKRPQFVLAAGILSRGQTKAPLAQNDHCAQGRIKSEMATAACKKHYIVCKTFRPVLLVYFGLSYINNLGTVNKYFLQGYQKDQIYTESFIYQPELRHY